MNRWLLCGLLLFGGLSYGQTADYCEGDDCPEQLTIEGFDVRISPNVYSAPDFTNTLLGQHLDTLKAQLLWMTSKTSVPPSAIERLIDSGVSIYIDADTNFSEWWPCGTSTAGCYNSGVNRVGMPFSSGDVRILETHTHLSFALHELAHAFHAKVVAGGDANVCIEAGYNRFVADTDISQNVEELDQATSAWEDGSTLHLRTPAGPKLKTQHYGATTKYEYFASMSNAMWHFYGHYPWNRNELWRTDPETHALIWNAWTDPDGFCPEQSSTGYLPQSDLIIEERFWP